MARLRGHRTLDVGQPLYVRRAEFTIAGRTFAAGEALPWRDLGIAPRKLHQLWHARLIGHEQANERNGAESPVALVRLPTPSLTVTIDTSADTPAEPSPSTPSDAGPAATTSPEQAARPAASTPSRPTYHKRR